jgi:hypothetical protein
MVCADGHPALLESDERVAEKNRLYCALDRMIEHKNASGTTLERTFRRQL